MFKLTRHIVVPDSSLTTIRMCNAPGLGRGRTCKKTLVALPDVQGATERVTRNTANPRQSF